MSTEGSGAGQNVYPKLTDATTAHGAVVQNQWYTVIDQTNIEVLLCHVVLGVANETIEFRATIDGIAFGSYGAVACTFAANNITGLSNQLSVAATVKVFFQTAAAGNYPTGAAADNARPSWCKGRSVKIEVRKTTAAGAATLTSYVTYLK